MKRLGGALCAIVFGLITLAYPIIRAQQPPAQTTLTGVLTAVWGDPRANSQANAPRLELHLTDAQGTTRTLHVDDAVLQAAGGLQALDGQQVLVTQLAAAGVAAQSSTVEVQALRLARPEEMTAAIAPPQPLTGPQPRALILCRFSDSTATTPHDPSYFAGLMGASWPGINHYWWDVSYNNVDLNGTTVYGWYNLPNPRSYYVYDSNGDGSVELNFSRAADDCTAVADADVFFPAFNAIDLNFNDTLDCCAWGGHWPLNLDGVSRTYGMTWMPPWSQTIAVYAHESGHSLGFPHSSGPYNQTYDSNWDPMSSSWASCRSPHPTYSCVPVHTIMFHKDLDLWIPEARRYLAADGSNATIAIESSSHPNGPGYLFAKIPIAGSTTHFYIVEARRFGGYDDEIPGEGVIIHDVLTTRTDRVAQVIDADNNGDPNDAGAIWTPGESFVDAQNGITVTVNSESGAGYSVTIARGGTVAATSVSPSAGTGLHQAFTLTYADSAGAAADLSSARVRFSAAGESEGTCTVRYNATNGGVGLLDDAGVSWLAGTLGSGTLANSQCTVDLAASTASANESNLTLVLDLTFSSMFGGTKQVSMLARSVSGTTAGWVTRGTWTVPLPAVSATEITPSAASGTTQSFTLTYSDTADVSTDLVAAQVRFSNIASGTTCVIHYRATTNTVRLQDDAGMWGAFVPFGSGTLANSRCSLDLAASSATPSGNDLSMTLAVAFTGAFSGPATIAMRANSLAGPTTGWITRGTFTVGAVLGVGAVSPDSGSGIAQTFTATFSDSLGAAADLKSAQVRIGVTSVGACVIHYNAITNLVRILDDAGNPGGFASFGSGTLVNSQCALDLAASSAVPSGNDLTLTLRLAFTPAFAGSNKPVSLRANSNFGTTTTGFLQRGTWSVAAAIDAASIAPNAGAGFAQTFTLAFSDAEGVTTDLQVARVRFRGGNGLQCVVDFNAMTSRVRLQDDLGAWGAFMPFGTGTIGNSQCAVNLAQSSANASGTSVMLTLTLIFNVSFAGTKTVDLRANTHTGWTTDWQTRGSWLVPQGATVTPGAISPDSGSGSAQMFTLSYSDSLGGADLASARVRFAASNSGPGSCTIRYNAITGAIDLMNDAATTWVTGALGSGTLANSQCTLDLATSSAAVNGTSLTLMLNLTFAPSFSGMKKVYMFAQSAGGPTSDWVKRGTWTAWDVLLRDDFTDSALNGALWFMPQGAGTFLGRTQLRPPGAPLGVNGGVLRMRLDTYNPTALTPGDSFWGTEIVSQQTFARGAGISFAARVRLVDPIPGGIVGSLFSYVTQNGTHDEIDVELLTNDIGVNRVLTNVFNDDDFSVPGRPQFVTPPGLVLTQFNLYEFEWLPDRVRWKINGQVVREEFSNLPDQPMPVRLNLWAPTADFADAFNAALQPASTASANQRFFYEVDFVEVRQAH